MNESDKIISRVLVGGIILAAVGICLGVFVNIWVELVFGLICLCGWCYYVVKWD